MIERESYIELLKKNLGNGQIKVITGCRRVGKSTILFELFYNYLLSIGVKKQQVIKIKLDERIDFKYRNPIFLSNYINQRTKNKKINYFLMIDEVQMSSKEIDPISNYLVSIYDTLNELKNISNLDIYVTGSNSRFLSKDILTEFRGRSSQIHIFPLSFLEYYSYVKGDVNDALNTYFLLGGMPFLTKIQNEYDKKMYLINLFDEVYLKDIVERNKIKKQSILKMVLDYLASTTSTLTNPSNIANVLSFNLKEKINHELVDTYITHIEDCFLVSTVKRYDIKGKKYLNYPNKYYFIDHGLRNARLNFRQYDAGYIAENIVYLELIRRGYLVDVGFLACKSNNTFTGREVDFVVNEIDKKYYVQVSYQISDNTKLQKELTAFKYIKESFKKIIIRGDIETNFYDDNGYYHMSLKKFLLGEKL